MLLHTMNGARVIGKKKPRPKLLSTRRSMMAKVFRNTLSLNDNNNNAIRKTL